MRQVVLRNGAPAVAEVPAPQPAPGWVLVDVRASVVSTGTEAAVVASAGKSLARRALDDPDRVRRALARVREQGLGRTVEQVRGSASADSPLGYSCAGMVLDTGGVPGLAAGQLVACGGAGYANHAEVVLVPQNLVVGAPGDVPALDAAFATVGAISVQAVRRTRPTLGERVVVIGLGLLGQLSVQILRAAGCAVVGVEPVKERRVLATSLGAEAATEPDAALSMVDSWTGGVGADAVIVAASSPGDAVMNSAVAMVRRKGRVVALGNVGLGVERQPLYEREADILISTSYGPGRYDLSYEEHGLDYPLPYVRWTEQRNMGEFLRLISVGAVDVRALATLVLPVEQAPEAYAAIRSEQPPFSVVLQYPSTSPADERSRPATGALPARPARRNGRVRMGIIGVGGFIQSVHLPRLREIATVEIAAVVSRRGTTATNVARNLPGAVATTDWREVVEDPTIDALLIGTRHDSHAEIATAALEAGKPVLVEKPLGLTRAEIDAVWAAAMPSQQLAVGFNRPLAPLSQTLERELTGSQGPRQVLYRVNANLPVEHWLNDPLEGGGRILGEACHMLDYLNWLCGTPTTVHAAAPPGHIEAASHESVSATISYANGSVATLVYTALGAGTLAKEYIEVHCSGQSYVLDDFRTLISHSSSGKPRRQTLRRQDKGHAALIDAFVASISEGTPPTPGLVSAYLAQSVALAVLASIETGQAVPVQTEPS